MEIRELRNDDVYAVAIDGKLDALTSTAAQEYLLPRLEGKRYVVLCMGDCTYVSSSGLRALMMAAKKTTAGGGKLALATVSDDVWDVMVMTGFDSIFQRYDTLDEAVAGLRGSA